MENKENKLTTEQYHTLYLRAVSRLEDIASQAELAMRELEEIQLGMGDTGPHNVLTNPDFYHYSRGQL